MLPSKAPPGGAKLNGFFVQIPTLSEKIEDLQKMLASGVKKEDKARYEQELENLLDLLNMKTPPPPPRPKFKLTGNLNPNAPIPQPPNINERPSRVPRDDWNRAQRMFMVVYDRVAVREKPNLRSPRIEILTRSQYIPIERETDHWVKIKSGGWVLKAQQKYGQLIVPVKQQHYESKYVPATTVLMFENGKMIRPFTTPQQQGGQSNQGSLGGGEEKEEDVVGRIVKRIVVAPPKYSQQTVINQSKQIGGEYIFLTKKAKEKKKEEKLTELASIPTPPPKGWEMLLHKPSGKMYYASLHSDEVRWTAPPPPGAAK